MYHSYDLLGLTTQGPTPVPTCSDLSGSPHSPLFLPAGACLIQPLVYRLSRTGERYVTVLGPTARARCEGALAQLLLRELLAHLTSRRGMQRGC